MSRHKFVKKVPAEDVGHILGTVSQVQCDVRSVLRHGDVDEASAHFLKKVVDRLDRVGAILEPLPYHEATVEDSDA